jgi:hypothetical protein
MIKENLSKNYIKIAVKNLIELHKTKNIQKLYKYYKINILYCNSEIKGGFFADGNKNFVIIKKYLSRKRKKRVLIHEFAHFLFHKNDLLHR